jgi:hypothetical protein
VGRVSKNNPNKDAQRKANVKKGISEIKSLAAKCRTKAKSAKS